MTLTRAVNGVAYAATDYNATLEVVEESEAQGLLDEATVTTVQGAITSTETDLTGMTVTFTLASTRKVSVEAYGLFQSTVAGDRYTFRIKQDLATDVTVSQWFETCETASSVSSAARPATHIMTLTAGTYTYKCTLVRASGTGILGFEVDANQAGWIRAVDWGAG